SDAVALLESFVDGFGKLAMRHTANPQTACWVVENRTGGVKQVAPAIRCWFERVRPAVTDEFASPAVAELFQKSDEIVGDVIDVRRVAPFKLPAFAKHLAGVLGHHQHGRHAEGMRHSEVAREVLEHRGLARIDGVQLEKAVVVWGEGLGSSSAATISKTASKWRS